jgi:hypothetical protein
MVKSLILATGKNFRSLRHMDDEDFRRRAEARAAELGKSWTQVMTEAGLAHDTFNNPPKHGRRIDIYEKVGQALGWDRAEALGIVTPQYAEAQRLADRMGLIADIASHLYVVLNRAGSNRQQPLPDEIKDAQAYIGALLHLIDKPPKQEG